MRYFRITDNTMSTAWFISLMICYVIHYVQGLGYSITGPEVLHVPPTEIDLSLSTMMVFTVSGCNEIHVYLCANEGDTTADYYELMMGTKTWLYDSGNQLVRINGNEMNCAGSVQFWMSWFFGELQFGKGSEYDPGTIIVGATQPGSFVITALSLEVSSGTTSFDPITHSLSFYVEGVPLGVMKDIPLHYIDPSCMRHLYFSVKVVSNCHIYLLETATWRQQSNYRFSIGVNNGAESYMRKYYDTLNVKVNGLKSVTTFMDENAYVDMWVAWTDSKTFSMGLGLEAGVNEHFNWADPDSEVEYNDIVSLGIGTWATEKLRITFYPEMSTDYCITSTGSLETTAGIPSTAEPSTAADTTTVQLTTAELTTEQPTTAELTTEQPTTAKLTTVQPTTAELTTEQPTTAELTTEQPTTAELTTEQPTTAELTAEQPTTAKLTTEQPTTAELTTVQPTTAELTTEQPTTAELTTAQPTTAELTTLQPTTAEITTVHPTTAELTTEQPTTAELTTVHPTTAELTTEQPTTAELTTVQPATTALTTVQPTTVGLTTIQPTTDDLTTIPPTTDEFTTVQPTTDDLTTILQTTADEFTTLQPTTYELTTAVQLTTAELTTFEPNITEHTAIQETTDELTTLGPETPQETRVELTTLEATTLDAATLRETTFKSAKLEFTKGEPTFATKQPEDEYLTKAYVIVTTLPDNTTVYIPPLREVVDHLRASIQPFDTAPTEARHAKQVGSSTSSFCLAWFFITILLLDATCIKRDMSLLYNNVFNKPKRRRRRKKRKRRKAAERREN